jgi:hypothetical protein
MAYTFLTDNEYSSALKMAVFWVVAPCSLVHICQRFRGAGCLHLQSDCLVDPGTSETSVNFTRQHGAVSQKAAILYSPQREHEISLLSIHCKYYFYIGLWLMFFEPAAEVVFLAHSYSYIFHNVHELLVRQLRRNILYRPSACLVTKRH